MGIDALTPTIDVPEVNFDADWLILDVDDWDVGEWAGAPYTTTCDSTNITRLSVRRGRRSVFDTMPAGVATFMLNNEDAQYDIADISLGQLCNIFANKTAGAGELVFVGQVKTVKEVIDPTTGRNAILINAVDAMRELQDFDMVGQTEQDSTQTVSERIELVLSIVASASPTVVNSESIVMPASTLSGSALGLINEAAAAGGGMFYVTAGGTIKYLSRAALYLAANYASPQATITDAAGSAYPAYRLESDLSIDRVSNTFFVTNSLGETWGGENGESVTLYGRRVKEESLSMTSNPEASTRAQLLADLGAAQLDQLLPVTVPAMRGSWPTPIGTFGSGIDITDAIDVTRGAVTTTYMVQGVSHTWAPQKGWETTLNLDASIPAEAT